MCLDNPIAASNLNSHRVVRSRLDSQRQTRSMGQSSPQVFDSLIGGVDKTRIERAVREILFAIGEDPDREGLAETPARVARAYGEIFAGLHQNPSIHLKRTFAQACDEVITVCGIGFFSVCEHHLMPFTGKVHIAYLPAEGRVVGLSKLARTVEVFARRPQIQERLTAEIADALTDYLGARGVIVVVEAEHLCMKMRGVRSLDAAMTTFARRGVFQTDAMLSSEVMSLINNFSRSAEVRSAC
jgi:GTP cyclohydrolase I